MRELVVAGDWNARKPDNLLHRSTPSKKFSRGPRATAAAVFQPRPLGAGLQTGWGGRDRTYECRNQNPVPYHLATPQVTYSSPDHRGCRSRPCAANPRMPAGNSDKTFRASASDSNAQNTQAPDPVIRASP